MDTKYVYGKLRFQLTSFTASDTEYNHTNMHMNAILQAMLKWDGIEHQIKEYD